MTDKDTIIAAQEAEILRLQSALDVLKNQVKEHINLEKIDAYDSGWHSAMKLVHDKICKIMELDFDKPIEVREFNKFLERAESEKIN